MEVVKALADKYPSENLLLVTHGKFYSLGRPFYSSHSQHHTNAFCDLESGFCKNLVRMFNMSFAHPGEGVGSVFSDIMNGVTVYDVEYCGYTILKRCIHLGENQSFTAGELTQQSEFGIKFLAAADE